MSQQSSKLKQQAAREVAQQTHPTAAREFATPEELIRFDAGQTSVPPAVGDRLRESLAQQPAPRPSWWRRLFGRR